MAIVGGSYSGLVLSNYLRTRSSSLSHVIFDRRCRRAQPPHYDFGVIDYGGGRSGLDVPSFAGIAIRMRATATMAGEDEEEDEGEEMMSSQRGRG